MSIKQQWAIMKVKKVHHNAGIILNDSSRHLWVKGGTLTSDSLVPYEEGTIFNVTALYDKDNNLIGFEKIDIAKESPHKTHKGITAEDFIATAMGKTHSGSLVPPAEHFPEDAVVSYSKEIGVRIAEASIVVSADALISGAKDALDKANSKAQAEKPPTPAALEGFYISPDARLVFNTAHVMSQKSPERAVKVMMIGESGYGKTTIPRLLAEVTGRKFMRMNCASVRDPEEWYGYREAQEGSTVFIRSTFIKTIEEGNCVVILDEFNRLEPWLHNTLMPLLDDDGATIVHEEEFRIGPGVIVVGTINTGYRYTGTFQLDEALMNRFEFILEVGPMPQAEERTVLCKRTGIKPEIAKEIVKMATILRQQNIICSTRTTLLIAEKVQHGMNLREAFEYAVVRRIPTDSAGSGQRKQVMDLVNVSLGVFEQRKLTTDIFASEMVVTDKEQADDKLPDSVKPVRLTLSRIAKPGGTFLRVQVIQAVRSLTAWNEKERIAYELTLRQGQVIVEDIENGSTAHYLIAAMPENVEQRISDFRNLGVHAIFEVL